MTGLRGLSRMLRRLSRQQQDVGAGSCDQIAAAGRSTSGLSPLAQAGAWSPTHRHRKGGLYRVLALGILEVDRSDAVIYDDADGTIWVRPMSEFEDGRFEALVPLD